MKELKQEIIVALAIAVAKLEAARRKVFRSVKLYGKKNRPNTRLTDIQKEKNWQIKRRGEQQESPQ